MNDDKNKSIEICYLWIEEYKGLKNVEINFSTEFKFYKDENLIKVTKKEEKTIDNFFGNNIINFSTIIGENGSGKTSILEFIIKILSKTPFKPSDGGFIIGIKNGLFYTFYSDCKYQIELSNLKAEDVEKFKEIEVEIFRKKKDREERPIGDYVDIDILDKNLNIIFLSNIFDNSREAEIEKIENYQSISTNYLLRHIEKTNNLFDNRNHIDIFQNEEFNRQIDFVKEALKNKFRNLKMSEYIEIPTHIKIKTIKKGSILHRTRSQQNEIFQRIFEKYIYDKIIKNRFQDINFENSASVNCIENYFEEIYDEKTILLNKQECDCNGKSIVECIVKDMESNWQKFNSDKRGFELCKDILKSLDEDLNIIFRYKDSDSNIYSIEKQKELIKNNIELIEEIKKIYYSKNQNNKKEDLIIDFINDNEKFIKIFELYKNSYIDSGFLIFNWAYDVRTLSSGENAMLNLFSRFYYCVNVRWSNSCHDVAGDKVVTVNEQKKRETVLLFMDEPEEYFHPEWQRSFINILIDFLQNIFRNFKIQLIITSNSPYLISDLPKENVIFLKNNKVCNNYEFKRTFGANIHTLLTNSFFMKNTIGEFANQKIKDSLKIMNKYKQFNDTKISEDEFKKEYIKYMGCEDNNKINIEKMKAKIKYIIEIIGEPLIKRKLEEIYRTTFQELRKDYELEIKKLQKEKAELQEIIKNKGLENIDGVMNLLNKKIKELKEKVNDKYDINKV